MFAILETFRDGKRYKQKLQCDCGKIIIRRTDYKSPKDHCGCKDVSKRDKIKINAEFGYLTIIGEIYIKDNSKETSKMFVSCKCKCGQIKDIRVYSLLCGETTSCGCYNIEILQKRRGENHPLYDHGKSNTPIFSIWSSKRKNMCEEWSSSFLIFEKWYIENNKQELSLTKKDFNQPHSPNNSIFLPVSEIARLHQNQEKQKQTMLDRYNVEYYSQSPDFENKRKKSNMERYGVEYPIQNNIIREKIKLTNKLKYGHEWIFQSPEMREKSEKTNIEKYGFAKATQNSEIKQKILDTKIKTGQCHYFNGKMTGDFAKEKGVSKSTFVKWVARFGIEFAVEMNKKFTGIEQAVINILDKHNINYIKHKKVGSFIPDFILENIIIECDGLFWHSDACIKNKNYHLEKKLCYKESGFDTLFFREDEINKKLYIVESIILNKLKMNSNRIFARKCIIEKGTVDFFARNHLMGIGAGKILTLVNNGEVVSAIQYFRKNGITEISRFCNKLNSSVVGGFSRLISKLEKPISTFIDLRYGSGSYLENLGFKKVTEHLSFKWVYGCESFHRMQYLGNSGYEHGLNKIWDCGQAKYVLDS